MPYDHGLEVLPLDVAALSDILYTAVARSVTPFALRQRTVDIVAFPPKALKHEQSVTLLVLVSVEDRPLPAHLNREQILDGLEAAGIKANVSLSRDSIWGQTGDVRFWIVIHKVPHNRGFDDVLTTSDDALAANDQEVFATLSTNSISRRASG
jgi:hypothetical protein